MSIWLEMARAPSAKAMAHTGVGTVGHWDRKDKTPASAPEYGVLSRTERFCPGGWDIQNPGKHEVSGVLSALSQCPQGDSVTAQGTGVLSRAEGVLSEPGSCPEVASRPSAPVVPLHAGMVVTWCGEWVSRDRWDAMSDLERHGPQGRLFCGKCWRWQDRTTALACLDGRPCQ